VYFINEEATLTISVRNPTSTALLIAQPFHRETGSLVVFEEMEDGTWLSLDPDSRELIIDETTPTIVLNPGEQRQITLKSTDSAFGSDLPVLSGGSVPARPGGFRLYYTMGGGRRNFRVVEPFFEAAGQTTMRGEEVFERGGVTIRRPQYLYAFAVRWEDMSYICVAPPTGVQGMRYPQPGQRLDLGHISGLSGIKRIFSSPVAIVEVNAVEEASGNFTISYRDANGQQGTIRITPGLAILP
jgi:hypothetical protein